MDPESDIVVWLARLLVAVRYSYPCQEAIGEMVCAHTRLMWWAGTKKLEPGMSLDEGDALYMQSLEAVDEHEPKVIEQAKTVVEKHAKSVVETGDEEKLFAVLRAAITAYNDVLGRTTLDYRSVNQ